MFNLEAEVEILGAILVNEENFLVCMDELVDTDFYDIKHRKIFGFMKEVYIAGNKINQINLIEHIGRKFLAEVGGMTYISSLVEGGRNLDLKGYINIIKKKSRKRKLRNMGLKVVNALEKNTMTNEEIEEYIYKELEKSESRNGKILNTSELLMKGLEDIEKRMNNEITSIKTGYDDYDTVIGGFKKGELVILAGRPSTGKTTLAVNFMTSLAENNYKTLFLELEMYSEEMSRKILGGQAKIKCKKLEDGEVNDDEMKALIDVLSSLSKKDAMFMDFGRQTIGSIKAKAKIMKETKGLDVLMLDYITLVNLEKNETRSEAIGELTRELKLLAKELDICVIAISQLSRGIEARFEKRPELSDLRGSGNIEQDADVVMFTYSEKNPQKSELQNDLELIIKKNRSGRTGSMHLRFYSEYQRILNYEKVAA